MGRRNTQMKLRVVLSSLLLGCLLVITAQGDSSARVVPSDQEGNQNKPEVTGIAAMQAQKEPFERNGVAYMRKLWLGGKKHTTHEETSMDSKNGRGANGGGTPKISGKEEYGLQKSFGSLGEQRNDQSKHMIMGPKASKFTSSVTPGSSPPTNRNTECSQDCNAVPVKGSLKSSSGPDEQQISEEPQGTSQKDESQSLNEAAKEIANLIYRDYKGRPSHKPPINNHEPGN